MSENTLRDRFNRVRSCCTNTYVRDFDVPKPSLFERLKRFFAADIIVRKLQYVKTPKLVKHSYVVDISYKNDDDESNMTFKSSFGVSAIPMNMSQATKIAEILYPDCYDIRIESVSINGNTMTEKEYHDKNDYKLRFNLQNMVEDVWVPIRGDVGIPEVELIIPSKPLVSGYMKYMIGNFRIDRDEYWFLTDNERQDLHDKHNPGSKAIPFDPQFAERYGKNPEGPF